MMPNYISPNPVPLPPPQSKTLFFYVEVLLQKEDSWKAGDAEWHRQAICDTLENAKILQQKLLSPLNTYFYGVRIVECRVIK